MGLVGALGFGLVEALARNTLGRPSIMDSISKNQAAHTPQSARTVNFNNDRVVHQQQTQAVAMHRDDTGFREANRNMMSAMHRVPRTTSKA